MQKKIKKSIVPNIYAPIPEVYRLLFQSMAANFKKVIAVGDKTSEKPDTHEVTEYYSFETDGNGRVTKVALGKDFHETIAIFYVAIYITLMCQVPYLLTTQGFTVDHGEDGSYLCLRDDIALKISGENGLVTFIELSRCEGR